MIRSHRTPLALGVMFFLFLSFAQAWAQDNGEDQTAPALPLYLTDSIRDIKGPRRTVAVGGFDSVGTFAATYGEWDIGGGLAAMLTSALVESDRFTVIERARLSEILTEQELSAAGLTPNNSASAGHMAGVQLLVYGAVTEFDTREKGGGLSIGFSRSLFKGGASRQKTVGSIAFDIRVVDTTTGEIIKTHSVSKKVTAKGFDLSVGYHGVSIGDNEFIKTPLGEASREAITKAVQLIARDAEKTTWRGMVVDYDGDDLYINAGQRSGIQPGDTFHIERIVKKLTDPQTGEVLLVKKKKLGRVHIEQLTEKLSYGQFIPSDTLKPQRGDLAVIHMEN